jgi:hypothetical protein
MVETISPPSSISTVILLPESCIAGRSIACPIPWGHEEVTKHWLFRIEQKAKSRIDGM